MIFKCIERSQATYRLWLFFGEACLHLSQVCNYCAGAGGDKEDFHVFKRNCLLLLKVL